MEMEIILGRPVTDREEFCRNAVELGCDEFYARKMLTVMIDSDLDVYQMLREERQSLILYAWQHVEKYFGSGESPYTLGEGVLTMLKWLAHHTLDLIFSWEFAVGAKRHRKALYNCMKRAFPTIIKVPALSTINWRYLLEYRINPWKMPYLLSLFNTPPTQPQRKWKRLWKLVPEDKANLADINFLEQDGLNFMLLRLIKLLDIGAMRLVRRLAMRAVAAWTKIFVGRDLSSQVELESEICQHREFLGLFCHIYLMTVYEDDDVRGYVIDNMISDVRFYINTMERAQEAGRPFNKTEQPKQLTPACFIARTCMHLTMSAHQFLESFVNHRFNHVSTSLSSIVSQAYGSYVLGNLLVEIYNMNDDDFDENKERFKRIFDQYVDARERSEDYLLHQLRKQELQNSSHNQATTMTVLNSFAHKMCKGNRLSNSCEPFQDPTESDSDASETTVDPKQAEVDRQKSIDPVFQFMPNNAELLDHTYEVLSKRTHRGWHFAKLILLLKIIGNKLNAIETWRYHPGLTTDFMVGLEIELSVHYEALAVIFQEHPFIEQEFWLTAFYLNPCRKYYDIVVRCGIRYNRKRAALDDRPIEDATENALCNAKFGLLSSTIDVDRIVGLTTHESPTGDYEMLMTALESFQLPSRIVNDLLTVTFMPRNKAFSWAVKWNELLSRCKNLLKGDIHKRRLVELNMAEANDRLKYLDIDYEKYKHRPQLDYGAIEQGYEGDMSFTENEESEDEYFEEEDEDSPEEYPVATSTKTDRRNSEEDRREEEIYEMYFTNVRRTRARTAAVLSNERARMARQDGPYDAANKAKPVQPNTTTGTNPPPDSSNRAALDVALNGGDLRKLLIRRDEFRNCTEGFVPFKDIWNFEKPILDKIDKSNIVLLESDQILKMAGKLDVTKNKAKKAATSKDDTTTDDLKINAPQKKELHEQYTYTRGSVCRHPTKGQNGLHPSNGVVTVSDACNMEEAASSFKAERRQSDDSNAHLMEECLNTQARVTLSRLTTADLSCLRQPVVRIKRLRIPEIEMQRTRDSSSSDENSDSNQTSFQTGPSTSTQAKRCRRHSSSSDSADAENAPISKRPCRRPFTPRVRSHRNSIDLCMAPRVGDSPKRRYSSASSNDDDDSSTDSTGSLCTLEQPFIDQSSDEEMTGINDPIGTADAATLAERPITLSKYKALLDRQREMESRTTPIDCGQLMSSHALASDTIEQDPLLDEEIVLSS